MNRVFCTFLLAAVSGLAEYKSTPSGAPPPEVSPATLAALYKTGLKVLYENDAVYAEMWMTSVAASGPVSTEAGVTLKNISPGTFMGVVRYPEDGVDRRSQVIPAGVYTLRYVVAPLDGSHKNEAAQRDFLMLSPLAEDQSPDRITDLDALTKRSAKITGAHAAVLSVYKAPSDFPAFTMEAEIDWTWETKAGNTPICIVFVSKGQ